MTDKQPTKRQLILADIVGMLRARHSLLWIKTPEELRADRLLMEAAAQARLQLEFWDCIDGHTSATGVSLNRDRRAPQAMLTFIRQSKERRVYVLHDLPCGWLEPTTIRALRLAAKELPGRPETEAATIVVLTPRTEIPPELAAHATVVEFPLPDREELGQELDDLVAALPASVRETAQNGNRDAAIDAAVGLTMLEAENTIAKSIATTRKVDPLVIGREKRRVIERGKGLTWFDPHPRGLDAIGGNAGIKAWVADRERHFSPEAIEFGLDFPRGLLLVGQPGCGKSLTAKCIGTAWKCPVLRFDAGGQKSKYVGESEQNIRQTFALAETVGKCVFWWDEIDKALGGSSGPQGDGGVATDQLGTFLTWRQECKLPVFVLATANAVTGLPPALFRAGRFDAVFFVDLPNFTERAEIAITAAAEKKRDLSPSWAKKVATATEGFTGSEIAALVPKALGLAFSQGREFDPMDMIKASTKVVPLSQTAAEEITALRNWAQGRALSAAGIEPQQGSRPLGGRRISLDATVSE